MLRSHVFPKEDSVVALAGRLKNWQLLESNDPDLLERDFPNLEKDFPHLEKELLRFYRRIVRETKARILQASRECDTAFLHRLYDAAAIVRRGKVSQSLSVTGAAVYAFHELRVELGYSPTRAQVKKRVDMWHKEGGLPEISGRQWNRTLKEIESLFRPT